MTLDEILDDLKAQLDWRGPGGQPQGHIVIPRSEAQELMDHITGDVSLRIACENIARLNDRVQDLTRALMSAMALQDALLTELGKTQGATPIQLIIAKSNFDNAMKKLLGGEQVASSPVPTPQNRSQPGQAPQPEGASAPEGQAPTTVIAAPFVRDP